MTGDSLLTQQLDRIIAELCKHTELAKAMRADNLAYMQRHEEREIIANSFPMYVKKVKG